MGQIKERMGHLVVYHWPHTHFGQGVRDLLSNISGTTCIHCGQPGRLRMLRMPGWVHPGIIWQSAHSRRGIRA